MGRLGSGALARVAVAGASVAMVLSAAGTASAAPKWDDPYLALGDSVAFGYVPPQAVPAPNYADAASFVGYPEDLGKALGEPVFNASCPGETTVSMIAAGGQSNGCENAVGSPYGYRTAYPLHVSYTGTQLAYAVTFLQAHRKTSLVTIDIGANDAFVCQETTADHCASPAELNGVISDIEQNLATIYTGIRDVAHYRGPLVALSYYSLSYSDPAQVAQANLLNSAIASVTRQFGGSVGDGFTAFQVASAPFGGSPCTAGLLIKLPDGTCNIHPSPAGHLLLAGAIAQAIHPGHRSH